ncbi:MAG: pseudouridine synthase [Lachnospiraceae bacterium]|nr:pseudouridine synthase [Lachnospiraceae bacterium]
MKEWIRLNKYISASGFCSRRKADEWIADGKVTVNGETADMGWRVETTDEVRVDGHLIEPKREAYVVGFYKPRGYACTAYRGDTTGIYRNFDLEPSLKYIGRLDKDSEGLLLLTNDGDLCNNVAKARNQHEKEYIVQVNRPVTEDFLKRMSEGVRIFDGNKQVYRVTNPCKVNKLTDRSFSIVLTQGMNRQIRRMCEHFDYRVVKLKRIRVMNVLLGDRKPGDIWELSSEELSKLRDMLESKK